MGVVLVGAIALAIAYFMYDFRIARLAPDDLSRLAATVQTKQIELREAKDARSREERARREAQAKADALVEELGAATENATDATAARDALQVRIDALVEQLGAVTESATDAKAARDALQTRIDAMESDYDAASTEAKAAREQLDKELREARSTAQNRMREAAELRSKLKEEQRNRYSSVAPERWADLATSAIGDEQSLRAFFARRQPLHRQGPASQILRIDRVVRLENPQSLSEFQSSGSFYIDPLMAHRRKGDTLLWHGCPQVAAANIQATGLLISFAADGMLGRGLYGAPDPRKSLNYCRSQDKFMFLCRFNLSNAKHAGPGTAHRNTVFDEFCVYDEKHVTILWMVKLTYP